MVINWLISLFWTVHWVCSEGNVVLSSQRRTERTGHNCSTQLAHVQLVLTTQNFPPPPWTRVFTVSHFPTPYFHRFSWQPIVVEDLHMTSLKTFPKQLNRRTLSKHGDCDLLSRVDTVRSVKSFSKKESFRDVTVVWLTWSKSVKISSTRSLDSLLLWGLADAGRAIKHVDRMMRTGTWNVNRENVASIDYTYYLLYTLVKWIGGWQYTGDKHIFPGLTNNKCTQLCLTHCLWLFHQFISYIFCKFICKFTFRVTK